MKNAFCGKTTIYASRNCPALETIWFEQILLTLKGKWCFYLHSCLIPYSIINLVVHPSTNDDDGGISRMRAFTHRYKVRYALRADTP